MKSLFLFSPDTVALESDLFTVFPGHVAILTAHAVPDTQHPSPFEGMPDEDSRILIERTSTPQGGLDIEAVKSTLDGVAILPKSVARYISTVYSRCEWSLDACNNLKVITVPGVYRLRMTNKEMIGTTVVEATSILNDQASQIPDSLKLGY